MPGPGEHKTVQARILHYAQEIGWRFVPRNEAEARRGFNPDGAIVEDHFRAVNLKNLLRGIERGLGDCIIAYKLLHFFVPNHGKLWKSLMRMHLGNYEYLEARLKQAANSGRK